MSSRGRRVGDARGLWSRRAEHGADAKTQHGIPRLALHALALTHPHSRPQSSAPRRLTRLWFSVLRIRACGLLLSSLRVLERLAYSAYTGFLQLTLQLGLPRLSHDDFEAYVDHVIATLVPA